MFRFSHCFSQQKLLTAQSGKNAAGGLKEIVVLECLHVCGGLLTKVLSGPEECVALPLRYLAKR